MDRRNFLKYLTLAGSSFALTSCVQGKNSKLLGEVSPSASPVAVNEPLKVGFVYVGSVGDFGWTYAHDLGRRDMEANLQDQVKTTFVENVNEGADAQRVIRQLALDGNKLIFTTSFRYMNPTIKVAKDFGDVVFEHCTGYKRAANVGTYLGRFEEPRYLTGMIAGKMTNRIGFLPSCLVANTQLSSPMVCQYFFDTHPPDFLGWRCCAQDFSFGYMRLSKSFIPLYGLMASR